MHLTVNGLKVWFSFHGSLGNKLYIFVLPGNMIAIEAWRSCIGRDHNVRILINNTTNNTKNNLSKPIQNHDAWHPSNNDNIGHREQCRPLPGGHRRLPTIAPPSAPRYATAYSPQPQYSINGGSKAIAPALFAN